MKPITLPTSEEVRAKLRAENWVLDDEGRDGAHYYEFWRVVDNPNSTKFEVTLVRLGTWTQNPAVEGRLGRIQQFASILGIVETPQTPAGDASKQRQYELALAALRVGVFPYPENDEGKRWTHIVRIPLFALPDDEHRAVLRRLYAEPNQRAESEWFPTPLEALAAAAEALGLEPIHLMVETPQEVTVPMAPVQEWLSARDAFEVGNRYAWEKKQRYYDASKALDAAIRAALSGVSSSAPDVVGFVNAAAQGYDTAKVTAKLKKFFADDEPGAGSSQVDGGERG